MFQFKQLINGEWVGAQDGGVWDLINPATEEVIEQVPFGGAADAAAAVDAAEAAFKRWSRTTPYERAAVLQKAAEWITAHDTELAKISTEESGKPYGESLAEWRSAPNYLIWAAEEAKRAYGRIIPARVGTRRIHVTYQPLGVVGTITAWNFPIYNVVRAWSSALAAGCTVVGRPSEYTPRSAMLIAQALHEAGAPAGVINLINGDPAAMGQVMLNDPRVRKISFTGSTRVGKLLMDGASRTVTQLALEMGGNAPVIVMPDAADDIRQLTRTAMTWKFRNCGQVCVSPQRFYVHSQIAEQFMEEAADFSAKQVLGNGLDKATTLGPLINATQRERVARIVADSIASGAEVVTGGARPSHLERGYFYQPTILANVGADSAAIREEIFGPIVPVVPFDSLEQAIALANASDYGLAAFAYTRDLNTAVRLSEELEYGMVCVNDWLPATPEAPFGGIKQSGLGRESGKEGLYEYMEEKTTFFGGIG
ncbi:MAG: NAD-dependent succinate-semialdehyde dehydrogenase [Chloroflexi bacterium]|nr:NAD-dependent succinate-semialdehyde dehydrogenase [Chloroflexota bacterium]